MSIYKVRENLVVEEIEDSVIIFDTDNERFFELEGIGSFIWKNLDNKNFDEVVGTIRNEFDVDEETAGADTTDFIKSLLDNKLIVEFK
ncbi:MAG: PqqD family protein [Lachnospiraceae bacterium]|nr:PqqD family protein [Lachnospiraceae bacterium]